jgi:hypothetical protein
MDLIIRDNDMPATFAVVDLMSLQSQRQTKLLVKWELWSLSIAALTGILSWKVRDDKLDIFAGVGAIAFLVALLSLLYRALRKPEDTWYEGRAAAESIKTLAWRFAVTGDPFAEAISTKDAERLLVERIHKILDGLKHLTIPLAPAGALEISIKMRHCREASWAERRQAYQEGRINDQINWYSARAAVHKQRDRTWTVVTVACAAAGFLLGGARFIGLFDVDFLGIGAAITSAALAWNQLNQNRINYASYSVAAHELRLIAARYPDVSQDDWQLFVSDAEDAISREHTMWLARQGHLKKSDVD